jgi:nicotinate-nucleotide adenylyltransferase
MGRAAIEQLRLDTVVFLPTGAPHYRQPAVASATDRVAMLKLALAAEQRFSIDTRELAPAATGYTVDTLREWKDEKPQDELFLLMGSDQYAKFESWRAPDEVARLAHLAVFARPGFEAGDKYKAIVVAMPSLKVSASDIRARLSRGESVAQLVPAPVLQYIQQHKLYH